MAEGFSVTRAPLNRQRHLATAILYPHAKRFTARTESLAAKTLRKAHCTAKDDQYAYARAWSVLWFFDQLCLRDFCLLCF
jgi:hypothetical protein